MEKIKKIPGLAHPITIEKNPARVLAIVAGRVVADTRAALTLRERGHDAVQYIPRKDVDLSLLQRSDHTTYCPYKGDCSYYNIPIGRDSTMNAVWSYEAPYEAVAEIKNYLAFYPEHVEVIETREMVEAV